MQRNPYFNYKCVQQPELFNFKDYVIGNATFPDTVFLPPSGAQRGSLMTDDGDPLTPFYPAKPYTFRTRDEPTLRKNGVLPNIPVMPIGYRDALPIFQASFIRS